MEYNESQRYAISMAHYPVPAIMGGVIWPISVFETDENMKRKIESKVSCAMKEKKERRKKEKGGRKEGEGRGKRRKRRRKEGRRKESSSEQLTVFIIR